VTMNFIEQFAVGAVVGVLMVMAQWAMTDTGWKQVERRVASRLGGRRIPGSGAHREAGRLGDVNHRVLHVEVKNLADKGHKWLWDLVEKNERDAKGPPKKTPVLALKRKGRGKKGHYWVVHDGDIMTLAREIFVAVHTRDAPKPVTEEQEEALKQAKDDLRTYWEKEVMSP